VTFFRRTVLAKAAKSGVRVNALAKEMGIESKDILSKLKGEGLDWAHNHMSTLTYGQAETVKEWYRSGQLGSGKAASAEGDEAHAAAEHEAEAPTKARPARKGKKRAEEGGGDGAVAEPPTEAAPQHETVAEAPTAPEESHPAEVPADRHAHAKEHEKAQTREAGRAAPAPVKLTPHVVPTTPASAPAPEQPRVAAEAPPPGAPPPPPPPPPAPPPPPPPTPSPFTIRRPPRSTPGRPPCSCAGGEPGLPCSCSTAFPRPTSWGARWPLDWPRSSR
jgi:hypothetical protein